MAHVQKEMKKQIAQTRFGPLHVLDAATYSWAGLCRLMRETAAKLDLVGAIVAAVCFTWTNAIWWQWAILVALIELVLAIEALNTAIEIVVNRVSPEWSEAAKQAKDLGSLAVALMLMVTFIFVVGVLVS